MNKRCLITTKYTYQLILLAIVIIFSSCSSKINLLDYKPYAINKTKYMPTKNEIQSKSKTKVIIADIKNSNIKIAQRAKLGEHMSSTLKHILSKDRNTKVIKRLSSNNFEKMIKKEIKIAEIGKETGDDIGQANYVITGEIIDASYTNTYVAGYYYNVKVNGVTKRIYEPAKRIYKACTTGRIQILNLPELDEKLSEAFDECVRQTHAVGLLDKVKDSDNSLVRRSGIKAINKASYEIRNTFVKKGYIFEARIKDDEVILKTTLSSNDGAIEGKEVNIFTIEQTYNPLTETKNKVDVNIGSGVLSNEISNNDSWIILKSVKENKNIGIGDYIKIHHERGFWGF